MELGSDLNPQLNPISPFESYKQSSSSPLLSVVELLITITSMISTLYTLSSSGFSLVSLDFFLLRLSAIPIVGAFWAVISVF